MQILKVVYSKHSMYLSHPWYIFGLSVMKTCNRNKTVIIIEWVKTAVLSSVKCLLTQILGSQNPWIWCLWVFGRGWKTMALEDQSPGVESPGKGGFSPRIFLPSLILWYSFLPRFLFCLVSETLFLSTYKTSWFKKQKQKQNPLKYRYYFCSSSGLVGCGQTDSSKMFSW